MIIFSSLALRIWRWSISTKTWKLRADQPTNIQIASVANDNGREQVILTAHQATGHFYKMVNARIDRTNPQAFVNTEDVCSVHVFLCCNAAWNNFARHFIFQFEDAGTASTFYHAFNGATRGMHGDGLMHYISERSDKEEFDNDNNDDNDDNSSEDDDVGQCPICHFYGVVNEQCPHCPDGTYFFRQHRGDNAAESSSDEEPPATQQYPENHEIDYVNLPLERAVNDLKQSSDNEV